MNTLQLLPLVFWLGKYSSWHGEARNLLVVSQLELFHLPSQSYRHGQRAAGLNYRLQHRVFTVLGWLHDLDQDDRVIALHRVGERPQQSSLRLRAGVHHDHDPPPLFHLLLTSIGPDLLIRIPKRRVELSCARGERLRFERRRPDSDTGGDAVQAEAR